MLVRAKPCSSRTGLMAPTLMPRAIGANEDSQAQTRALRPRQAQEEAQAQARQALAADLFDAAQRAAAAQARSERRRRPDAPGRVRGRPGRAAAVARRLRPA